VSTTLLSFADKQWISDFLKWELDQRLSRKVATVGVSQTLVKGQVVANSGSGINDVQVFTLAGTIASGTLKFQYGYNTGLRTTALTGTGVTAATIQTALRSLGVTAGDVALAACTVALSVAAAGVDTAVYTITCSSQYVPALQVVENGCLTAGAVACTLGSTGYASGATTTSIVNVGVHTAGSAANSIVLLPAAVAATDEVVTLSCTTSPSAGTFAVRIGNKQTAAVTYNVSIADLNTALDNAFGVGYVVATGDGLAGTSKSIILTFSGGTYASRPITEAVSYRILTAHTTMAPLDVIVARTTPGVSATIAGAGACGIMLQDITTSSSVPKDGLLVTSHAKIDVDQLSFGDNVTTDAQKAVVLANLASSNMLIGVFEPSTTQTQTT
jgi:hypothetical protein